MTRSRFRAFRRQVGHRAYARRASMKIPALEEFEVQPPPGKILQLQGAQNNGNPPAGPAEPAATASVLAG